MNSRWESKLSRDDLLQLWEEGEPVELVPPRSEVFSAKRVSLYDGSTHTTLELQPVNLFTSTGLVVLNASKDWAAQPRLGS